MIYSVYYFIIETESSKSFLKRLMHKLFTNIIAYNEIDKCDIMNYLLEKHSALFTLSRLSHTWSILRKIDVLNIKFVMYQEYHICKNWCIQLVANHRMYLYCVLSG
jgi:hypothetical protein